MTYIRYKWFIVCSPVKNICVKVYENRRQYGIIRRKPNKQEGEKLFVFLDSHLSIIDKSHGHAAVNDCSLTGDE